MSNIFGTPMVLKPVGKPAGCVERITGFLLVCFKRLAWVLVGVVIGYGCAVIQ